MNEQQRFLLISNRNNFGSDLRSEDVFSYLQSKFVLSLEEIELIRSEKTSQRRTKKLLSAIPGKGSSAFVHFHDALKDAGYDHLADLLTSGLGNFSQPSTSEDEDDMPSVETILRDGGVPKRPIVYANRPRELAKLQSALRTLEKTDGWVLLHGMAGSGKSILAADAIADQDILSSCFPGGVFWVSLGVLDEARLLMKMQNLCAWLDSEQSYPAPRNVEEARVRIRILFAHDHPRSLLILDDLWTKEDARYFDVRVRTLVTSRNDFVTDSITGHIVKVQIEESLTEDQSKNILAQWTNQGASSLPGEALGLIEQCRGSPLAISMIGALLRGHSNRWEYYLKQLRENKVCKLKSKLAYDYPSLCEAISISVDNLPTEMKEKYAHFAVFEEDSRIPAKVLGLLWDEDEFEVEDTMDELISRSLARRYPPSKDLPCDTYGLHDLQLDFLKEGRPMINGVSTLSDLHKILVDKYSSQVNGDLSSIENDGYVYWNIIKHLIEAGMRERAVELLLSFDWIEAKLNATGAPDLINNYQKVMQLVDKETKSQLEDYVHFIGINSYLLSTPGHQEYNLIQLALSQPFATRVHVKAIELVKSSEKKDQFYVGWCNQPDESSETCLLTVKHHDGPVYCCHWSQNGSDRIVSCGVDFKIKIWNSCTGQSLITMNGHSDTVYCCQFSSDAAKVVSSSADKTIKIWDANTGSPLLTFRGHDADVYCCKFSPVDNNLIATCSADSTIKIWDVNEAILLRTLTGHTDSVNWCCFSPDGRQIASASNDHTLKIWNVDNGVCLLGCCGDKDFISFCIYHPTDKHVLATSQNYLQLVDSCTGKIIKSIKTMVSVLSATFSPDGKYAVGTYADSTAQLWNLEAAACMGIFRGHSGWLHSVAFSPDGQKIVTASSDETCKIWKVKPVAERAVKNRKLFDANCDLDEGPIVVIANSNSEIQVVDGTNGKFLRRTASLGSKITACRLSVDGKIIIVGLKTGQVKLMETETCTELHSFVGHCGAISDCIVTSDGISIVTASEDKTIKIWHLKSKQLSVECNGHTDSVTKCASFHASKHFVSSSYDGTIKVWDMNDGKCLFTCHHSDNNTVLSCTVSFDDQVMMSTSADTTAKLWNAKSGALIHVLRGHSDCVRCSAFTPDCAIVATGSDDSTIKIWDTKTGDELVTCESHKVWVTDIRFSSDGKRFTSVSSDIKWWKRDGTLLQTFLVRGNYLRQIQTSKNFDRFITIDDTGQLYILNAPCI